MLHEIKKQRFLNPPFSSRRSATQVGTDLKEWLQKQNIDLQYYYGPKGGHMNKHMSISELWY